MKSRLPVVAVVYLAVPLLFIGPSLFSLFALSGADWTDLIYPFHWFSKSVFQEEGRLPFWNPYIFSGQPHLASLNVLAFYPTELLSFLMPLDSPAFYALDLIIHVWAAGILLFVYLRACGLSVGASFFGGLAYMLGGHLFSLAGAGHPHVVRCLAWLPLVFFLLKRAGDDSRLAWYALCGAVISLFALTAAVQLAVYLALALAFWVPFTGGGKIGRKLAGFGVLLLVLAGSGAVVFLPGFEHYLNSIRVSPEKGFTEAWSLSFPDMLTWLVPGLFGQVSYYCGPHQFRTTTDYFGLLPLCFAALAFFYAPRRGLLKWLLLGVGGIVLALAGGRCFSGMPVLSGFRNSLRALSLTHVAVSVLAAYGWERSFGRSRKGLLYAAAFLVLFGAACGFMAVGKETVVRRLEAADFYKERALSGAVDPEATRKCVGRALTGGMASGLASGAAMAVAGFGALPACLCQAVIWSVAAADMLYASSGYFKREDSAGWKKPDAIVEFLKGRTRPGAVFRSATDEYFTMPNRRMYWKTEWTWGYHGVPLERYVKFHRAAVEKGTTALFSLLNVRYLISSPEGVSAEPMARFMTEDGEVVGVYGNTAVLPRAWLAKKVLFCENLECALEAMRHPGFTPDYVPVEGLSLDECRFESEPYWGAVESVWGRDEIRYDVTIPRGGILVFSEIWYPAWKAFVDGRRAPVMKAYGTLRAVRMPAGKHQVKMIYDSTFFKLGLLFSALTAAALGAALLPGRKTG